MHPTDDPDPRPGPGRCGTAVDLLASTTVDEDVRADLVAAMQRERLGERRTVVGGGLVAVVVAVAVSLGRGSVAIGVVGALVALGILVLLLRASTRTRVLKGYAEGSTLGVGLGQGPEQGTVRLDTGPLVEVLDPALFSRVVVRRRALVLRLRRGGTCLLPAGLLTDADLDRLRAGVAAGPHRGAPPSAGGPLPWSHTMGEADTARRRTRLLRVVRGVRRPTYLLVLVVAVSFAGLTRSPWPLAVVAVIALQDLLDRRWVARSDSLVYAVGATVRAGVLEGRLVVQTAQALLSRPLDLLVSVEEVDGLVVLGWDLPSRETQHPAGLLPAEALEVLRAAVAARPADRPATLPTDPI